MFTDALEASLETLFAANDGLDGLENTFVWFGISAIRCRLEPIVTFVRRRLLLRFAVALELFGIDRFVRCLLGSFLFRPESITCNPFLSPFRSPVGAVVRLVKRMCASWELVLLTLAWKVAMNSTRGNGSSEPS